MSSTRRVRARPWQVLKASYPHSSGRFRQGRPREVDIKPPPAKAHSVFCCFGRSKRGFGPPGVFSRFAPTIWLAKSRGRRHPPAVAPIRNIASTADALAIHHTKGSSLRTASNFRLRPRLRSRSVEAEQALAVESNAAACARDQEAMWANRQVAELAGVKRHPGRRLQLHIGCGSEPPSDYCSGSALVTYSQISPKPGGIDCGCHLFTWSRQACTSRRSITSGGTMNL